MQKYRPYKRGETSLQIFIAQLMSPFIDGFVLMLALGGLSHQLHKPHIAIAYWSCVLIALAAMCVFPSTTGINIRLSNYIDSLQKPKEDASNEL